MIAAVYARALGVPVTEDTIRSASRISGRSGWTSSRRVKLIRRLCRPGALSSTARPGVRALHVVSESLHSLPGNRSRREWRCEAKR